MFFYIDFHEYFFLDLFSEKLFFLENLKLLYLLLSIFITLISYVIISIFTKAFKLSDIKLNYN